MKEIAHKGEDAGPEEENGQVGELVKWFQSLTPEAATRPN